MKDSEQRLLLQKVEEFRVFLEIKAITIVYSVELCVCMHNNLKTKGLTCLNVAKQNMLYMIIAWTRYMHLPQYKLSFPI